MNPVDIQSIEELSTNFGMPKFVITQYIFQADRYYSEFSVSKKNGKGTRRIAAPSRRLKGIQRWILDNILSNTPVSESCTGYTKKRSVVDNAKPHVDKAFVVNADIKDFFPSITIKRVIGLFQSLGYNRTISFCLARLCCFKGRLPQGAPSSPMIANLICRRLDTRLQAFAAARSWAYTRYSDDITISGSGGFDNAKDIFASIGLSP